MEHSIKIGGSSAKRAVNCPGSIPLAAQVPREPASEYAMQGTMLHEAIALIMNGDVRVLDDLVGFEFEGQVLTHELAEEMLDPALEAFAKLDKQFGPFEYVVEQRVEYGGALSGCFGTTDILGVSDQCTLSLDWKFGRGVPVYAEDSEQGLFYAGAARYTPDVADMISHEKPLLIAIVQPAVHGDTADTWFTTLDRVERFEWQLKAAMRASQHENPPMMEGDHCRWCPAKAICPLLAEKAIAAQQRDITTLTPMELSKMLTMADIAQDWGSAVYSFAYSALEKGFEIPGYKLVQKRATRKPIDDAAYEKKLVRELGVKGAFDRRIKSPAQAEKALKAAGKDPACISELVQSVSSGLTVVPDTDKRPAVHPASPAATLGNALKALTGETK